MSRGGALLVPGLDAAYTKKIQNIFGNSLIGYYVGGEPNGAVAIDDSGRGFNGAYTGVTLGQPGIGDGLTCPLYDGANDFMQPPAGFRNAFTPLEFSILLWYWPVSVAPWTDGTIDYCIRIGVDANNSVNIFKSSTNSVFNFQYVAGGTSDSVSLTSQSFIVPNHLGLTVSVSADQLKAYQNGIQAGATQATLGTWVGTPAAATTVIGASVTTPTNPANGYLQHVCVLNRAATPAEVAAAAVI